MNHRKRKREQSSSTSAEGLTPWLEQAREEVEMLRRQHSIDSPENQLLGIVEDILTTAEDAITCIRNNSWSRLFVFLERIEDRAHEGIDQLGPSFDVST